MLQHIFIIAFIIFSAKHAVSDGKVMDACSDYRECLVMAEKGNLEAQIILSNLYLLGKGVNANREKSEFWMNKAAENGDVYAQERLSHMCSTGEGCSSIAFKWLKHFAHKENSFAMENLGDVYYEGNDISQDYFKASVWYTKAAEQGNISSAYKLGDIYYYGGGLSVEKNYAMAIMWYTKAAEQGYSPAQLALGTVYEETDEFKDLVKAYAWYYVASKNGEELAKEAVVDLQVFSFSTKAKAQEKQEAEKLAQEYWERYGQNVE